MVVKRQCSFCAQEIEPGTGMMFVKRDGTVYHFCSSSCRKQQLHLGRVGHRFKWTRAHELKRAADRSSAAARTVARETPAEPAPRRPRGAPKPSEAPAPSATEVPPPAPPAAATATPAEVPKTPAPAPKARAKPRKKAEPAPSE
jgi:large subunit ribosomal protein L24e